MSVRNIYWKTIEIWCPYPANDCIDKRIIHYSSSKGSKFDNQVFLETENTLTMEERKNAVAFQLRLFPRDINLIHLKH
jgi:hypothetical protein